MDRSQLLEFIGHQREKLKRQSFDLSAWKTSTTNVLRNALGPSNSYAQRIDDFDYVYKTSHDELYPQKVADIKTTMQRLGQLCDDMMDELRYVDPAEIGRSNAFYGRETLQTLAGALRNQFSGGELNELQKLANSDREDKRAVLADHLKQVDVDKVQRTLAALLAGTEIWKELKSQ